MNTKNSIWIAFLPIILLDGHKDWNFLGIKDSVCSLHNVPLEPILVTNTFFKLADPCFPWRELVGKVKEIS